MILGTRIRDRAPSDNPLRRMTLDDPRITILEVPCTREGGYDAFTTLWQRPHPPSSRLRLRSRARRSLPPHKAASRSRTRYN